MQIFKRRSQSNLKDWIIKGGNSLKNEGRKGRPPIPIEFKALKEKGEFNNE